MNLYLSMKKLLYFGEKMVEEKILPGKYIYVSAKIKAYAGYYVRAPFQ